MSNASVAVASTAEWQAIKRGARQTVAGTIVGEIRARHNGMCSKLQLTLVQQNDSSWIEEKSRRVFRLSRAAGECSAETTDALFVYSKTARISHQRNRQANQAEQPLPL